MDNNQQATQGGQTEILENNLVPVFIGCQDPKMIDQISKFVVGIDPALLTSGKDYTVVVMSREVLEGSVSTWFFQQLNQEQQQKIIKQQNDTQLQKTARNTAMQLDTALRTYLGIPKATEGDEPYPYTFKYNELKHAVKVVMRKDLSNKQIRELIDFMTLHNVLQPCDINAKFNNQTWEFTFDDLALLENVEALESQVEQQIATLQNQQAMLRSNRELIEKRLEEIKTHKEDESNNQPEVINDTTEQEQSKSVVE